MTDTWHGWSDDSDDCDYCGAPPHLQDPHAVGPDDGMIDPAFCKHCGALVDEEGKVYGP